MNHKFDCGMFPFSADPFHFGHLDIVRKAAVQCRTLLVVVLNNDTKKGKYLFDRIEDRVAMTVRAIKEAGITNVQVIGSGGLLVDVYLREGCNCVFRGVRNDNDKDFEEQLTELNRMILPDLVVEYIEADPNLVLVSSTNVKAFASHNADTDGFVPIFIKQALEVRQQKQKRVAITGGIGVGKSWVGKQLALQAKAEGLEATHLNVDQLLRDFYDEQSAGAQLIRVALERRFGKKVLSDDKRYVHRKELGDILFRVDGDADREFVTRLTKPHVHRKFREALVGVEGLVIVEWAQLAEMDMGRWTNNNVVVVDSPDRATFLAERGVDAARMAVMDTLQLNAGRKSALLQKRATEDRHGTVIRYDNLIRPTEDEAKGDIERLLEEVLRRCFSNA